MIGLEGGLMAIIHLFIKRPIIGIIGVGSLASFSVIENRIPEKITNLVYEAEKNVNAPSQAVFDFLDDRAYILQKKRNIVLSEAKSRQLKRSRDEMIKRQLLEKRKTEEKLPLGFL